MKLSNTKNNALKTKLKKKLPAAIVDSLMDNSKPHNQNVKKLIAYLRGGNIE